MTTDDANSYLASKGLRGRPSANNETLYPCFLGCAEQLDSRKRKLYVKPDGVHNCFVCGSKGGMKALMEHFGDQWTRGDDGTPAMPRRRAALKRASELAIECLTNNDKAMMYLLGDKRHLTPEEIVEGRFGWADKYVTLSGLLKDEGFTTEDLKAAGVVNKNGPAEGQDTFRGQIVIPYIVANNVVQLRGKDPEGRYYTAQEDRVRLYGQDDVDEATDIIVVEGEFDRTKLKTILTAADDPRLRKMAVVGLPGVQSVPEDFQHLLRDARRVFIGTDPDQPGRDGGAKLTALVGPRARLLNWPEHVLERVHRDGVELKKFDWSMWAGEYDCTWQQVGQMLRDASGRRLATMSEAGHRWRTRPTGIGLRTGFTELDAWIEPGLLPGQLMIPIAKTGVGKTVLLCNLAYNMRHRRVLFITLEMTAEEIYMRMARIYRFYWPHAADPEIEAALSNLLICDENRLSERDFAELVEEYELEKGAPPEAVLVDYLGYYARGAKGGSPYEKTSNAAMQLKAEAKSHKLVVIAPHQVSRGAKEGRPIEMENARDSGVVEETADFLPAIYRPDSALTEAGGPPSGKLRFELLKSRHGNAGKVCTLQMGLLSLVMLDQYGKNASQAEHECFLVHRGETYEAYIRERGAPVQSKMVMP